ncbi:MAG: penicillin binding protein PBP4B [Lachnospiraceae bacterium]|nr:penicillin binding protein PBP4B [Lachnospiraceae bacterium]
MFKKLTAVLIPSFLACVFLSACSVAVGDNVIKVSPNLEATSQDKETGEDTNTTDPGAVIEETVIPDYEWQLDVTFPDWRGDISSTYPINNCVGFYGYSGQGQIYLECDDDISGFDMFINGRKIDVSSAGPGKSYLADISSVTVNGINSVQVSGIEKGNVRVCVPYPVIISGTPEEVGIDDGAFELIDRIISADIENGFSSAQLAVIKDGRLVYENTWGNVTTYGENKEPVESEPVTSDTLYDLASNTKMYSVNYALQYLLTKGEIDLSSRIVDIMGSSFADDTIKIDYENREEVSLETNKKWKEELTIRDLLRHQGGFPPGPHYYNDRYDHATQDFDSDNGNVIYVGTEGDMKTREETWKALCQTPLMYEPGSETVYSDVDYMILCYCIEEITGKGLDKFLSEVFFSPMQLKHITYNPLENGFTEDDCAATELMGNTRDGRLHYSGIRENTLQGETHDPNAYYCMAGISGHAGLFSNASDLAKLASVMLTGGYGDKKYFSQDAMDLFTAPKGEAYPNFGLGWWREADHRRDWYFGSITDSDAFGHQGFTGTLSMIDPDNDLVIVLLTNKIHTPMMENDETLGKWYGNFYTTASLGFAPQIIKMGMAEDVDENVWGSLASDMAADMKRQIDEEGITDEDHPRLKAYKALLSISDQYWDRH